MRDGITTLATDVSLPSRRPGLRWPVLLQRTPYARPDPPRAFLVADYAVAVQSTRGREDSDGEDEVFDDDGWGANQDGYDAVEWLAAQPFADGQVGTFGASASGMTQLLLAGAAPPHLVCSIAEWASADRYHHMTYPGGVFLKSFLETWLANQGSAGKLLEFWAHPDEDAYWDERNLMRRLDQVRAPILHIGGWYDLFSQGRSTSSAPQRGGRPGARGNQKLVIGPWATARARSRRTGALTYPAHGLLRLRRAAPALVRLLAQAEGHRRDGRPAGAATRWTRPPGGRPARQRLAHPRRLATGRDPTPLPAARRLASRLAPMAPGASETTYLANPAQPVPTRGGATSTPRR